jgi:hypothetical protein
MLITLKSNDSIDGFTVGVYLSACQLFLHFFLLERSIVNFLAQFCNDAAHDLGRQVFQLETAMGSAIECFDNAGAIVVPRSRFSPVKTCNELFALRSDAFKVTSASTVELATDKVSPYSSSSSRPLEPISAFCTCTRSSVSSVFRAGSYVPLPASYRLQSNTSHLSKPSNSSSIQRAGSFISSLRFEFIPAELRMTMLDVDNMRCGLQYNELCHHMRKMRCQCVLNGALERDC